MMYEPERFCIEEVNVSSDMFWWYISNKFHWPHVEMSCRQQSHLGEQIKASKFSNCHASAVLLALHDQDMFQVALHDQDMLQEQVPEIDVQQPALNALKVLFPLQQEADSSPIGDVWQHVFSRKNSA